MLVSRDLIGGVKRGKIVFSLETSLFIYIRRIIALIYQHTLPHQILTHHSFSIIKKCRQCEIIYTISKQIMYGFC